MDEFVAMILVVGCLVLLFLGIDGEVKSILAMAAGWAFKGGRDRLALRSTPSVKKSISEVSHV